MHRKKKKWERSEGRPARAARRAALRDSMKQLHKKIVAAIDLQAAVKAPRPWWSQSANGAPQIKLQRYKGPQSPWYRRGGGWR